MLEFARDKVYKFESEVLQVMRASRTQAEVRGAGLSALAAR